MLIKPPFESKDITQGFGENLVSVYGDSGLKGHTGIDYKVPFGTPIPSAADSFCYSTQTPTDPDYYRAVYTIVDEPDFSYEISYGHCKDVYSEPGKAVAEGEIVGTIGNAGIVYWGQHRVTREEKLAGSTAGAHLHFQVRKCKRVKTTSPKNFYLRTANGLYKKDGFYYEVVDYDNGYNGCVDPAQFWSEKYFFARNLGYGSVGLDVIELQRRLGVSPTWFVFGPKTRAAVVAYQVANGIPGTGFVGPLTRAKLNQ